MKAKLVNESYNKNLNIFSPVNIQLLRDLNDILKEYTGEGIEYEYMDDSNLEKGTICQLNKYPDNSYAVGFFNNRGNGKGYYTIYDNRLFVEDKDFIFI